MNNPYKVHTLIGVFILFTFSICQDIPPEVVSTQTLLQANQSPSPQTQEQIKIAENTQKFDKVSKQAKLNDLQQAREQLLKRKEQILKISPEERERVMKQLLATRKKMNLENIGSIFQNDPLQDNIIREQQQKDEQNFIRKNDQKLNPWVAQELDHISQQQDIHTREQFAFIIKPNNQFSFKWNPSKKGNFRFMVSVYELISQKDLVIPQNPDEDQYIEVSSHSQISTRYQNIGKVYIQKMFVLDFFSDYQIIKLKNFNDQKMIVEISLQSTVYVVEQGIHDDVFKYPAQKSQALIEELKQTQIKQQKMFKAEWSFKDREQRHQSEMLILTGVELVVILGTAIVQMWCIKQLLDNRIIV